MDWFQKLERKYSKYAIQNLMMYIIVLYAVGFVFEVFAPGVYSTYLSLDFAYIFKGQIWRLVTFIIQPPSTSIIFVFFSLYFYYLIGTVLENIWGSFKFNVYFFSGVILNIIAALIIYLIFGISFNMSTHYINLALFMAFAMEQPDMEVLLFFVIPIKIKWMALLDGIVCSSDLLLRLLHRRIIIRLCIQQEKHRRIMAADRALMKHFIMPIVKRQHGRGLISHTDLLMEHLSTNVLCVEERN